MINEVLEAMAHPRSRRHYHGCRVPRAWASRGASLIGKNSWTQGRSAEVGTPKHFFEATPRNERTKRFLNQILHM